MNKITLICLITIFTFASSISLVYAGTSDLDNLSVFRSHKLVNDLEISTPTVLELPLEEESSKFIDVAVLEIETQKFQPYFFQSQKPDLPIIMSSNPSVQNIGNLYDGNISTYVDYPLVNGLNSDLQIIINSEQPITSSSLLTKIDRYVSFPDTIKVSTNDEAQTIVITADEIKSDTLYFPRTSAKNWIIDYSYSQPLRITELKLIQGDSTEREVNSLRFLARPNMSYEVYFDSDRFSEISVPEAGNLLDDNGLLEINPIESIVNSLYSKSDVDGDNIPDENDNCVKVVNPEQIDLNGNGRGDLCDDFDKDGILNIDDNCLDQPNRNQLDTDGDGIGDECDLEESRLTESNPWIPWVSMVLVISVVGFLFFRTIKKK